ncbi:MAG: hypothetical protein ACLTJG_17145 [[Clostridium] innocuum]
MSVSFEVKYEDILRIEEKIKKFQGNAEEEMNRYLRDSAAQIMIDAIVAALPMSSRNKSNWSKNRIHAKVGNPLEAEFFNLSVKVKSKKDFYYLQFPDQGTGTSEKKQSQNFMERGLLTVYDQIVDGLLETILTTFNKED